MNDIAEITEFLNEKADQYNRIGFIETDPVSIPHRFSLKEDIEISGFLSAALAWGNRKAIIKSANQLMEMMDESPLDFVVNSSEYEINRLGKFVYRTFNGFDIQFFIRSLKKIYQYHGGLESVFMHDYKGDLKDSLIYFRKVFMGDAIVRTGKHVADVQKGSTGKRLNMYLRWMVRNDNRGVDFGLWKDINPGHLYLPLDLHTGNVGRKLGLLKRKQNDWKAVDDITSVLRKIDSLDPIKYDFALFGLGVFEKF
ncbi:MAG: TIGR02757 family protein [Marinilabiliaceae bacterium]|nr:TIGR02757 family protein [Marinilabiliaceae bacterium]